MDGCHVLEIGSGTGQHAVFFATELPDVVWHSSDRAMNLAGISDWLTEAGLKNTPAPIELDVNDPWPHSRFDAIYTANTLHIMSWPEVERLFHNLPSVMEDRAKLIIYGPFNYEGAYTSQSNAEFDQALRAQSPTQGIRDYEAILELARTINLVIVEDRPMPANNRCLIFNFQRK
jgi:cyclopropane fatty-acyl-phospholipid synthase-like methyltransferase